MLHPTLLPKILNAHSQMQDLELENLRLKGEVDRLRREADQRMTGGIRERQRRRGLPDFSEPWSESLEALQRQILCELDITADPEERKRLEGDLCAATWCRGLWEQAEYQAAHLVANARRGALLLIAARLREKYPGNAVSEALEAGNPGRLEF